ncbi:unnamed protein product [Fraxinus pennsylvanica]|uniref:Bromo domain-containing protein n=1 Tax=Fraxinus pennsylvanica TaxID=56036 RepID=A0AAD2AE50_9LAMI|nr:unnamed protein product [Fraxinus pennsylvanica]
MGKVATGTAMKRKKRKGRPAKPLITPTKPSNYSPIPTTNRRSTRRNPNFNNSNSPQPEFDDDDDERQEKKVKLVVRLPQSVYDINQKQSQSQHSRDSDSEEVEDSDAEEGEDQEVCGMKRKINAVDHRSSEDVSNSNQEKKVLKTTDTEHGSPQGFGPTVPLPDKKLVVFILDRLQKKDTHGVFSEPVDPDELPDYHEIIKHPMDFGTVRKKLDGGAYKNLEELEADVLLICSNAMQYNAPDTIYFRQARAIRELAKRDFENLKQEGDDGEPQPKIVRRGRPPSKNQKKSVETSPVDHVGPEMSSGATLASGEDKGTGSNSYNLRKGPMFYKFRSTDPFVSSYRPRGENYSEWLVDWNDEFPASILKADMKYGKKQFTIDENRRDTYRQFHPLTSDNEPSVFSNSVGDMKRLMPVGLHFEPLAYARSLARFAANLGPVAWKVASKKIESVLPAGVKFGPGWVGQYEAPSQPLSFSTNQQKMLTNPAGDCHSSRMLMSSNSDLKSAVAYMPSEEMVEAVKKLDSKNEVSATGEVSLRKQFQAPWKSIDQGQRNGFSGLFGYDLSGTSRGSIPGQSGRDDVPGSSHTLEMVSRNNVSMTQPSASNNVVLEEAKLPENWSTLQPGYVLNSKAEPNARNSSTSSWQTLSMQQRPPLPIPPDLNVRVQGGSPSSSLQMGSPHQPDLALQL